MRRVATGAHLPTTWLLQPAKRPVKPAGEIGRVQFCRQLRRAPRQKTPGLENPGQLRRESVEASVTSQSQIVAQTCDETVTQTTTGTGMDTCVDEQYYRRYERPVHEPSH